MVRNVPHSGREGFWSRGELLLLSRGRTVSGVGKGIQSGFGGIGGGRGGIGGGGSGIHRLGLGNVDFPLRMLGIISVFSIGNG